MSKILLDNAVYRMLRIHKWK